jgi:RHS repeat-associated protein
VGSVTSLYAYNGDGARLRQIIAGTITTYTQDLVAPLPVVLQAQSGTATTKYLYSLGTRPLAQKATAWEYLLPDALGSVRQIADVNGYLLRTQDYEPYGSVLNSSGSGQSAYGFAGEQIDTTGLIYLRARYMQPTLGIFLTRDPWSGDVMRPITYNGYIYGEQNPVLLTDPSGKCPICWIIIALLAAGCSSSSGDSCPALTGNLRGGPFDNLSRAEALIAVQQRLNIQLPPGFQFEYAFSGPIGETGRTHWFDDPEFGKVSIYEWAFKGYAVNPDFGGVSSAYDIEAIMVHEALHAWQVYSVKRLAETDSNFKRANTGNPYQPDYTKTEWLKKHLKVFEWQSYTYVEEHTPPLCPSDAQKSNNMDKKNQNLGPYPLIDGLPTTDRIPIKGGYPLP